MNQLAALIQASFHQFADRPALKLAQAVLTYSELEQQALGYASAFRDLTPEGCRIGILAQRSVEAYASILGAVFSGRAYVPINPKAPYERQRGIAEAAGCSAFVVDARSLDNGKKLVAEFGGHCIPPGFESPALESANSDHGAHAYIMFTSGTTGVPKGVAVRYDNVAAYVSAFASIAQVYPEDRCSQFFDLSFDLSVHDMFVTWASGAMLCVPTDEELIDPLGFAARESCTCWFSVPSVASFSRRTRRLKEGALPAVRLALFCGEPLPTSLAIDFASAAPNSELFNLYGPTEATIAITAQKFIPDSDVSLPSTVPLGVAYPGCAVMLVDGNGRRAGVGESGELWLAGAQLTDGYVNNPDEQTSKFVTARFDDCPFDRWYRSGDIVRDDLDFGLVYQSRLDDQVKIFGYRVEILDIEEALRKAASTADVAAIAWPVNEGGSADGLVAFLPPGDEEDRQILAKCRGLLPAYMVPKKIIRIAVLPLNSNGKVDRKILRARYLERS